MLYSLCDAIIAPVTSDTVRRVVAGYRKNRISGPHFVPSAVLIPLVCKGGELHVLLTERTEEVGSHKGQVCFPGGSVHPDDKNLLETALREAWEETGIDPADVDIIGEIDDNVVASTGYVITPFVGFVPYPYPFSPNVSETKEIFFVPLSLLMDESRFRDQERVIGPYSYQGPVCDYDGHIIWGATARILKHLVSLLAATDDSSGPVLCDSSG
ncbi:MAG TPA: CoA pyrophosphatase [Dehalococcoidia bacterium]|nr:CoA pyrophosphatase [Dehalococcoidia bacterium]